MAVIIQLFQHFFMLGSVQNEMLLGKALISREGTTLFLVADSSTAFIVGQTKTEPLFLHRNMYDPHRANLILRLHFIVDKESNNSYCIV